MLRNITLSINSQQLSSSDDEQLRNWIEREGGLIVQDSNLVLTLENVVDKTSVLPHWIDDSVKLRRQIPIDCYLFPDPPIITGDFSMCRQNLVSDIDTVDLNTRTFYFDDKNTQVELATDLKKLGAMVVDKYQEPVTDVVIEYRKGQTFIRAEREHKDIGSSDWIRRIIKDKSWSDPKLNLVYYPIPPYHIPDMENAIITVSGYTGQTRLNIAKMVVAIGATFTRYLTESHTHLISAFDSGEKYDKAAGWNIHIVNLTWIEEVFKKWEYQKESSPRFVTFNTGYLEMNTRIDDVEQWLVDGLDNIILKDNLESKDLKGKRLMTESTNIAKKVKLSGESNHVITFTGCRPTEDEENVEFMLHNYVVF